MENNQKIKPCSVKKIFFFKKGLLTLTFLRNLSWGKNIFHWHKNFEKLKNLIPLEKRVMWHFSFCFGQFHKKKYFLKLLSILATSARQGRTKNQYSYLIDCNWLLYCERILSRKLWNQPVILYIKAEVPRFDEL